MVSNCYGSNRVKTEDPENCRELQRTADGLKPSMRAGSQSLSSCRHHLDKSNLEWVDFGGLLYFGKDSISPSVCVKPHNHCWMKVPHPPQKHLGGSSKIHVFSALSLFKWWPISTGASSCGTRRTSHSTDSTGRDTRSGGADRQLWILWRKL